MTGESGGRTHRPRSNQVYQLDSQGDTKKYNRQGNPGGVVSSDIPQWIITQLLDRGDQHRVEAVNRESELDSLFYHSSNCCNVHVTVTDSTTP